MTSQIKFQIRVTMADNVLSESQSFKESPKSNNLNIDETNEVENPEIKTELDEIQSEIKIDEVDDTTDVHIVTKIFKCDKCTFCTTYEHKIQQHKYSHKINGSFTTLNELKKNTEDLEEFNLQKKSNFNPGEELEKLKLKTQDILKKYGHKQAEDGSNDESSNKINLKNHNIQKLQRKLDLIKDEIATVQREQQENSIESIRKNHPLKRLPTQKKSFYIYKSVTIEDFESNANQNVSENADTYYSCQSCNFSTGNEVTMYNHVRSHRRRAMGLAYECEYCDFKSYSSSTYRHHVNRRHDPNSKEHQKVPCTICGKVLKQINMRRHLLSHAEGVPCKICGKVLSNVFMHNRHAKLHIKKDCICEVCGQTFEFEGQYLSHVKGHRISKKNAKCEVCDKVVRRSCMQKHLRSHTGERPYQCEFCGKGFSSTNALKTHTRQHTNETPYKCDICKHGFRQRVSLKNHMRSQHHQELGSS